MRDRTLVKVVRPMSDRSRTLAEGRAILARRAEIRRARAIRDHELAASERAAFYRVMGAPHPQGTRPPHRTIRPQKVDR